MNEMNNNLMDWWLHIESVEGEVRVTVLVTTEGGTLYSPGYPDDYGHNLHCVYHLRAPEGHKIRITFLEFSVEDRFDYLRVLQSHNNNIYYGALLSQPIGPIDSIKTPKKNPISLYWDLTSCVHE